MAPSSPKPASDRSVVAAAFAAIALFVVSWTLLHVGFYKHKQLIDTPVYQRYGNAIADGKVPYRDFEVEYPPGALPVFALPGLAEPGRNQQVSTGFRRSFETLMWLCGAAALAAMAVILRALRRSAVNVWAALCFAAIAPLLLGSVDSQPLRSLAGGARRRRLWQRSCRDGCASVTPYSGSALLRSSIRPCSFRSALRSSWKRAGRREALTCLALALGVVAAVFAPFVILAPDGVWHSLSVQLTPAAAGGEPRLGTAPGRPSRLRARRDGRDQPRLPESRRPCSRLAGGRLERCCRRVC